MASHVKVPEPLYIFLHVPKCGGTTLRDTLSLKFDDDQLLFLYAGHKSQRLADNTNPNDPFQNVDSYLNTLSPTKKDKLQVIFGHSVYYGMDKHFPARDARYITFLRHPITRTESVYKFKISTLNKMLRYPRIRDGFTNPYRLIAILERELVGQRNVTNFASWIRKGRGNAMTRFLFRRRFFDKEKFNEICIDDLRSVLGKFFFVGVAENANDFLFVHRLLQLKYLLRRRNVANEPPPAMTNDIKAVIMTKNKLDTWLYTAASQMSCRVKSEYGGSEALGLDYEWIRLLTGESLFFLRRVASFMKRRARRFSLRRP